MDRAKFYHTLLCSHARRHLSGKFFTRRDSPMTSDLHLDGPPVTVFGDHDALDAALSDELDRRGRSTHTISTPMGWLTSVTHAVIRLNTLTGEQALQDLASRDVPATQVVAVCELPRDGATTARVDELCRRCCENHEISLIWHAPFELRISDAHADTKAAMIYDPDELAVTIVNEIWQQETRALTPSFASHNFGPTR